MKRIIAIALALMFCLSAMSMAAFAAPDGLNSLAIVGTGIPGVGEWDPADAAGDMTEVSESVYQLDLAVPAGTSMKFKFAGNDAWDDAFNLGSAAIVFDQAAELENGGGSQDMELNVANECTLRFTVDVSALANGGKATLVVQEVKADGTVNEVKPAVPGDPAPEQQPPVENTTGKYIVHASVPAAWQSAFIWAWDANNNNAFQAWPGQAMTKGEDGYWTAEVALDYTNFLVVEKDGGPQTADLKANGSPDQWVIIADDLSTSITNEKDANHNPSVGGGTETEPPVENTTGKYTVHASVPGTWKSVFIWAWDANNTSAFEAWPGQAMVKGEDGYWTADVLVEFTNFLIVEKDGGPQTGDLKANGSPDQWVIIGDDLKAGITNNKDENHVPPAQEEAPPEEVVPDSEKITVYAMVPFGWSDVRVWGWDDNQKNATSAEWPGDLVMTKGEGGWYAVKIPNWVNNILVNANAGGAQTADLKIEAGKDVWIDCTNLMDIGIYYELPEDVKEPTEPEATEPPATDGAITPTAPSRPALFPSKGNNAQAPAAETDNTGLIVGIVIAVVAVAAGAVALVLILKKKN